jgi:hypothetical protein
MPVPALIPIIKTSEMEEWTTVSFAAKQIDRIDYHELRQMNNWVKKFRKNPKYQFP